MHTETLVTVLDQICRQAEQLMLTCKEALSAVKKTEADFRVAEESDDHLAYRQGRDPSGRLSDVGQRVLQRMLDLRWTDEKISIRTGISAWGVGEFRRRNASSDLHLLSFLYERGFITQNDRVYLNRDSLPGNRQPSLRLNYDSDRDYFTGIVTARGGRVRLRWANDTQKNPRTYSPARLAALVFNRPYAEFDGTDYAAGNPALLRIPGGGFQHWMIEREGHPPCTLESLREEARRQTL